VGALFGFISWMRDQAGAGYSASYSQVIADEIACGLFCLMKDECGFTLQKAYDYHVQQIAAYIDLSPWGDSTVFNLIAAYLGFDDLPPDIWVNGMFALFVGQLLLFEQQLTQEGAVKGTVSQFQKRLLSWMNDPNPDWVFVCTDCATPPATIEIYTIASQVKDLQTGEVTQIGSTSYTDWLPFEAIVGRLYEFTGFVPEAVCSFSGGAGCANSAPPVRLFVQTPANLFTYAAGSCAQSNTTNGVWAQNSQINVMTNTCELTFEVPL